MKVYNVRFRFLENLNKLRDILIELISLLT